MNIEKRTGKKKTELRESVISKEPIPTFACMIFAPRGYLINFEGVFSTWVALFLQFVDVGKGIQRASEVGLPLFWIRLLAGLKLARVYGPLTEDHGILFLLPAVPGAMEPGNFEDPFRLVNPFQPRNLPAVDLLGQPIAKAFTFGVLHAHHELQTDAIPSGIFLARNLQARARGIYTHVLPHKPLPLLCQIWAWCLDSWGRVRNQAWLSILLSGCWAQLYTTRGSFRTSPMAWRISPFTPSSKSTFSQPFKEKRIHDVVRIGSNITLHLRKLWKAKFFILCDVVFLARLQGKLEIDHS